MMKKKHTPKFHLAVRGAFDAASRSKDAMKHYAGSDALSADAALSAAVRHTVISRARYECANNGFADGIIQTLAEDAIGTGPRLQLFITDLDDAADEIHRAALQRREIRFRRWTEAILLTEKLKLARIAKARDGEVFIRIVKNPKLDSHAKIDISLYEAEQIGSRILSEYADYYQNGNIKEFDGIQFDQYGNPIAYRFWRIHPGSAGIGFVSDDSFLVPADQVIHYAHYMRPGQHRGMSEIASSLNIFNDLRRFTNAVLAAAETAAEISFLLHTDTPADTDAYDNSGSGDGEKQIQFLDVVELVRNAGLALPEGWKADQMKAEHPTDKYVDFVDAKITEAARPLSMPFAVAKGDCSKSNYASGRLDHQAYHKKIFGERARIESTILNRLLKEFEAFDSIAYAADYNFPATISHKWMWDGFGHVDPVKEANAQATRLASRTTTLAEECARDGRDYELILRQIAREKDLARKLGILAEPTTSTPAGDEPEEE